MHMYMCMWATMAVIALAIIALEVNEKLVPLFLG